MYIIERGLLARLGRVLGRGCTCGEDMILSASRRQYSARALTYIVCQALYRKDLFDILDTGEFPNTRRTIRRAAVRLAFLREIIKLAAVAKAIGRRREEEGLPEREVTLEECMHAINNPNATSAGLLGTFGRAEDEHMNKGAVVHHGSPKGDGKNNKKGGNAGDEPLDEDALNAAVDRIAGALARSHAEIVDKLLGEDARSKEARATDSLLEEAEFALSPTTKSAVGRERRRQRALDAEIADTNAQVAAACARLDALQREVADAGGAVTLAESGARYAMERAAQALLDEERALHGRLDAAIGEANADLEAAEARHKELKLAFAGATGDQDLIAEAEALFKDDDDDGQDDDPLQAERRKQARVDRELQETYAELHLVEQHKRRLQEQLDATSLRRGSAAYLPGNQSDFHFYDN